ncbi:aldehyde dehydrogenase family protein [Streptomyces sp. M19]
MGRAGGAKESRRWSSGTTGSTWRRGSPTGRSTSRDPRAPEARAAPTPWSTRDRPHGPHLRARGPADVDAAVAAAADAFPAGPVPPRRTVRSAAPPRRRPRRARGEFVYAESLQCGKPVKLSAEFDVPGTVDNAAYFAGAARHLEGRAAAEYSGDHTSYVRREPIGVIGSIAPGTTRSRWRRGRSSRRSPRATPSCSSPRS